nr:unnamed protein product [Digitaria exilis]
MRGHRICAWEGWICRLAAAAVPRRVGSPRRTATTPAPSFGRRKVDGAVSCIAACWRLRPLAAPCGGWARAGVLVAVLKCCGAHS